MRRFVAGMDALLDVAWTAAWVPGRDRREPTELGLSRAAALTSDQGATALHMAGEAGLEAARLRDARR